MHGSSTSGITLQTGSVQLTSAETQAQPSGSAGGRDIQYARCANFLPQSPDTRYRPWHMISPPRYRLASLHPKQAPETFTADKLAEISRDDCKKVEALKLEMKNDAALIELLKGEHELYNWLIFQARKIEAWKNSHEHMEVNWANAMTCCLDDACRESELDWRTLPLSLNYHALEKTRSIPKGETKRLFFEDFQENKEKDHQIEMEYFLPPWGEKPFAGATFNQVHLLYWEVRQKFGNIDTREGFGHKDFVSFFPKLHQWMIAFHSETNFEQFGFTRLEVATMKSWLSRCEEESNALEDKGYPVWTWEAAAELVPGEHFKQKTAFKRFIKKNGLLDLQLDMPRPRKRGRPAKSKQSARGGVATAPGIDKPLAVVGGREMKLELCRVEPRPIVVSTDMQTSRRGLRTRRDTDYTAWFGTYESGSSAGSSQGSSQEKDQPSQLKTEEPMEVCESTAGSEYSEHSIATTIGSSEKEIESYQPLVDSSKKKSKRPASTVSSKSSTGSEEGKRKSGRGSPRKKQWSEASKPEESVEGWGEQSRTRCYKGKVKYRFDSIPEALLPQIQPGGRWTWSDDKSLQPEPKPFSREEQKELDRFDQQPVAGWMNEEALRAEISQIDQDTIDREGPKAVRMLLDKLSSLRDQYRDEFATLSFEEAYKEAVFFQQQSDVIRKYVLAINFKSLSQQPGPEDEQAREKEKAQSVSSEATAALDELGRLKGVALRLLSGIATERFDGIEEEDIPALKLKMVREFHRDSILSDRRLFAFLTRADDQHALGEAASADTGAVAVATDLLKATCLDLESGQYGAMQLDQPVQSVPAAKLLSLYADAINKLEKDYKDKGGCFILADARLRFEKIASLADHLRGYFKRRLEPVQRKRSQVFEALFSFLDAVQQYNANKEELGEPFLRERMKTTLATLGMPETPENRVKVVSAIGELSNSIDEQSRIAKFSGKFIRDPEPDSGVLQQEPLTEEMLKHLAAVQAPLKVTKTLWREFAVREPEGSDLKISELTTLLSREGSTGFRERKEGVISGFRHGQTATSDALENAIEYISKDLKPDPTLLDVLGALEELRRPLREFQWSLQGNNHEKACDGFTRVIKVHVPRLTSAAEQLMASPHIA